MVVVINLLQSKYLHDDIKCPSGPHRGSGVGVDGVNHQQSDLVGPDRLGLEAPEHDELKALPRSAAAEREPLATGGVAQFAPHVETVFLGQNHRLPNLPVEAIQRLGIEQLHRQ